MQKDREKTSNVQLRRVATIATTLAQIVVWVLWLRSCAGAISITAQVNPQMEAAGVRIVELGLVFAALSVCRVLLTGRRYLAVWLVVPIATITSHVVPNYDGGLSFVVLLGSSIGALLTSVIASMRAQR
jgi:hypothetical protein